jgi:hypothetical protein
LVIARLHKSANNTQGFENIGERGGGIYFLVNRCGSSSAYIEIMEVRVIPGLKDETVMV